MRDYIKFDLVNGKITKDYAIHLMNCYGIKNAEKLASKWLNGK